MNQQSEIDQSILTIAKRLKAEFLGSDIVATEFSIFLCGGAKANQRNFRRQIGIAIMDTRSKYRYRAYYAEEMFLELLFGHSPKNLLSLENILAKSVNAIVILLESPGTFAELGAFANHDRLKHKLIVISDPRYRSARSFIQLGPVRYLRNSTRSKVHYIQMVAENTKLIAATIAESCREIAKTCPLEISIINPIFAVDFYLSLIYILGPISQQSLIQLGMAVSSESDEEVDMVAQAVVNGLIKEGKVACQSNLLSVTGEGRENFIFSGRTKRRSLSTMRFLSNMRFEAINKIYRGKQATKNRNIWE